MKRRTFIAAAVALTVPIPPLRLPMSLTESIRSRGALQPAPWLYEVLQPPPDQLWGQHFMLIPTSSNFDPC